MGADASVQGWSEELSDRAIEMIREYGGEDMQSLAAECQRLRAEVAKLQGMVQDLARKLLDTQLPGPDLGGEG